MMGTDSRWAALGLLSAFLLGFGLGASFHQRWGEPEPCHESVVRVGDTLEKSCGPGQIGTLVTLDRAVYFQCTCPEFDAPADEPVETAP